MIEYKILSTALNDRSSWDKVRRYLVKDSLTDIGKKYLKEINKYYEHDPAALSCDRELITQTLLDSFPKYNEDIIEYGSRLTADVSEVNVIRLITDQHKQTIAEKIAIAAAAGTIEEVDKLISEYNEVVIDEEDVQPLVYTAPKLDLITHAFNKNSLIPIYPSALNQILGGGVPRQSLIGIVARPDIGKTTVAMNIVAPVCEAGFKAIYFGNEDPDAKMILRALTRFTRKPKEEILDHPDEMYELALKNGYNNFTFISLQPGTIQEITQYVDEFKPDLIVVDQIRNLRSTKNSDGLTENLNKFTGEIRALVKRKNMVGIVVTQAGESAHNKLILDITDVEYSNTGFAAALDLMIGVGQNTEFKSIGRIMLSFPKNKMTDPIDPLEAVIQYTTNRVMT